MSSTIADPLTFIFLMFPQFWIKVSDKCLNVKACCLNEYHTDDSEFYILNEAAAPCILNKHVHDPLYPDTNLTMVILLTSQNTKVCIYV